MRKFLIIMLIGIGEIYAGHIDISLQYKRSKLLLLNVNGYTLPAYKGLTYIDKKGAPSMLADSRAVLLPQGAIITQLKVLKKNSYTFDKTYKIYPFQGHSILPMPGHKADNEFTKPSPVYYKSDIYPLSIAQSAGSGEVSGFNIANIIVHPLIFHASAGKLEFIDNLQLRIYYELKKAPSHLTETQLKIFKNAIKELVYNPQDIDGFAPLSSKTTGDTVEMAIVTVDSFIPYLEPFRDWKIEKGIPTQIFDINTITSSYQGRDNAEKLRNFIKDYYQNHGLIYVLLAGQGDYENNEEIIPRRDVYYINSGAGYYNDEDTIPSDMYFSCLDGSWDYNNNNVFGEIGDSVDMYADVYVGRAPVKTTTQVQNFVSKVLTYEQNPPANYLSNALLPAVELFSSYNFWGDTVNNTIADTTPTPPWTDEKLYESLGNLSEAAVIDSINSGVGFIHHADHGNEDGTYFADGTPVLVKSGIASLTNQGRLNINTGICCFSGALDEVVATGDNDCFSEDLVNKQGGGSVASIMNSRYGWGYPPVMGPSENIDQEFYAAIFNHNLNTLGQAIAFGKEKWIPLAIQEQDTGVYRWCIYELNIFGDPSMQVWSAEPVNITATLPDALPIGQSDVSISSDDGNGYASFVEADSIIGRGQLDANGNGNIHIQTLYPGDTVIITLTGKNKIPFVHRAIVVSNGAYVSYRTSNVNDASGNNNGRINPGEVINLNVLVVNWGTDTAKSVTGTLSTTDTYTNITASASNFGDISPGDSTFSQTDYTFHVDSTCQDYHSIPFTLTLTDGDSVWVSHFSLSVYAPVIETGKSLVIDTASNCNNDGVAEPGEDIGLMIKANNTGHEEIYNLQGHISSSSPYITITETDEFYGDIAADSSAFSSSAFQLSIQASTPDPYLAELYIDFTGDGYSTSDTFYLLIGHVGYHTDVEDTDTVSWNYQNPWHVTQNRYNSASHAFYFGTEPADTYPNSTEASLTSPIFTLGEGSRLSFYTFYSLEENYDYGYVEISADSGNSWQTLYTVNDTSSWKKVSLDLSSYQPGTRVMVRFRAKSDVSVTYEGWYIDDIRVEPPFSPPHLTYKSLGINDATGNGNGLADPGEAVKLNIALYNDGGKDALGTSGILYSLDPHITVTDNQGSYGDISGYSEANCADSFAINVASNAELGSAYPMQLITSANSGTYTDTLNFSLTVGDKRMRYIGPDTYGYYIYDLGDPYDQAPQFNWHEINTTGNTVSNGDDSSEVVGLPFTFKYYGINYDSITICSNGWVAMGRDTSDAYSNSSLPDSSHPNNTIAGLWDDLDPTITGSGKIYYSSDTLNHIFIVEYDDVYHYSSTTSEKFEIILYDPAYDITRTGDGNIIIQYLQQATQSDFTVGIEDSTGARGIQWYKDGVYNEYALPLVDTFAIKITTDTPIVSIKERNVQAHTCLFYLGQNRPNPFNGRTNITYSIPADTHVKLFIFDISGRIVKKLVDRDMKKGMHTFTWDGTNKHGRKVVQGIYFYELQANKMKKIKKMMYIR